MKTETVTVARIYLSERDHELDAILRALHDEHRVRGVTVFRGIRGFGASGEVHESRWLDLSLDLPVVIEFFDRPERVAACVAALGIEPGHCLTWRAEVNA